MSKKPDFFRWRSMYNLKKKIGDRSIKELGPKEYYSHMASWFARRNDGMSIMSCNAELDWYQSGTPYYKIWPAMAHALSNINIDIAGSHLHLPFPTFEVALPKDNGFQETLESPKLCALLVYKMEESNVVKAPVADGRDYTLIVHYQFDTCINDNAMGWYYAMGIKKDETIAHRFNETWEKYSWVNHTKYEGYCPSKEFAKSIITLAIATAFFGTHQHNMIMPDIPNRLIERYHNAVKNKDEKDKERVLEKAKNLDHYGWKVGSEIDLPTPEVRYLDKDNRKGEGTRGELNFGHIRSGHMRLQPYGKKDEPERYELIFVPPCMVRPDLPLRDMRGYRIQDSLLEK